ncbi:hypothetical protein GvMRE_IIg301 [endosymbiont GvMRE of Glomus versiforme]|nr:hypothetical protein GvMRE_IIg301 [endosymbiont GvMRE of Glomus versiforme]
MCGYLRIIRERESQGEKKNEIDVLSTRYQLLEKFPSKIIEIPCASPFDIRTYNSSEIEFILLSSTSKLKKNLFC